MRFNRLRHNTCGFQEYSLLPRHSDVISVETVLEIYLDIYRSNLDYCSKRHTQKIKIRYEG